nr:MAG TPA: hypothetical protein [Caudoviricetes sp.]
MYIVGFDYSTIVGYLYKLYTSPETVILVVTIEQTTSTKILIFYMSILSQNSI